MGISSARLSKILNLSTGHLTQQVAADLTARVNQCWLNALIFVENREYGWFVHVPDAELQKRAEFSELPTCLRECLELALSLDAEWILFDRDEDAIETLPYYNW